MKTAKGHGLILSILINMIFRAWWLAFAFILLVLHFVLGWPWWLCLLPIICWILHAVIITLVLGWASNAVGPSPNSAPQENKNPYSKKNSDYLGK